MEHSRINKTFEFKEYNVRLTNNSIFYSKENKEIMIPSIFNITIDKEEYGGKIEIKFKDKFGSEMIFIHYEPSSLFGMFEFIRKGYNIEF